MYPETQLRFCTEIKVKIYISSFKQTNLSDQYCKLKKPKLLYDGKHNLLQLRVVSRTLRLCDKFSNFNTEWVYKTQGRFNNQT